MNNQSETNHNRTGIWVALLVVILAAAAVAYLLVQKQSTGAAAVQYQTAQVAKGTLTDSIDTTGTVRSNQMTSLSWKTSGTIDKVNVQAGDQVETGDVLASLLPDANQSAMQALLVTAQENLAQLTSAVAVANAKLAVTTAQKNVIDMQNALNNTQYWQNNSLIQNYYANFVLAKSKLDNAQTTWDNLNTQGYISTTNEAAAYQALYNAQQAYKNASYYYSLYSQAPTQRQMNEAQANLDLANATLNEAQIYLSALTGGTVPSDATGAALARLDQARMAVQNAQDNMDIFKITAPFSGTITEVFGMAGDQVAPTLSAFRMDDLSQLKVDVPVSEVDIDNVQVNQPVALTFDAIAGKAYHGKVEKVSQVGNTVQGAADFTVTLVMTDPDANVKPGMTATVSIIVKQLSNVLLVPSQAVRLVNHQHVVYVLQNGQPQMVTISMGTSSNNQDEVVSGNLKAGDVIILNPLSNLITRPN